MLSEPSSEDIKRQGVLIALFDEHALKKSSPGRRGGGPSPNLRHASNGHCSGADVNRTKAADADFVAAVGDHRNDHFGCKGTASNAIIIAV